MSASCLHEIWGTCNYETNIKPSLAEDVSTPDRTSGHEVIVWVCTESGRPNAQKHCSHYQRDPGEQSAKDELVNLDVTIVDGTPWIT